MPQPSRIALLGVHTLAARLVIYASGFVASVFIARALGPEGRGIYVLPVALATIVIGVTTQGLELAQVRLWATRNESARQWASSANWLAVPVGVLGAAAGWIVYELGRSGPFSGVTRLEMATILVLLPIWVHGVLIRGLLVVDGALATVNRALAIGDLCRTAIVIALFASGALTVEVVLALTAVLVVVPWVLCWRAIGGPRTFQRPGPGLIRQQLSAGVRLAPHFFFLTLNLRLDVLLVAAFVGAKQVGLYSVAVLIAELVWVPTWALAQATKEAQAGAEQGAAGVVTARALRVTLLVSALCALALALAAPAILAVVFGSDFSPALTALWLLLPASAAMAVWRLLSVFLARLAPIRVPAAIALAALFVNCSLNLILIPAIGIAGAALASTAGYGCGALLALRRFRAITGFPASELVPRRADLRDVRELVRPRALRRRLGELRAVAGA
jgi:O-antigen/teichoic acid export membrane protein